MTAGDTARRLREAADWCDRELRNIRFTKAELEYVDTAHSAILAALVRADEVPAETPVKILGAPALPSIVPLKESLECLQAAVAGHPPAEPLLPDIGVNDEQWLKVVAFHRDMAARFAEDRDVQKHRAREAEAEVERLRAGVAVPAVPPNGFEVAKDVFNAWRQKIPLHDSQQPPGFTHGQGLLFIEMLRDAFHSAAVPAVPPQPIETAPRDEDVFFWIVPKTADEAYTDTSGKPIVVDFTPHWHRGKFNSWSALSKATHWHRMLKPPDAALAGVPPPQAQPKESQ